MAPNTDPVQRAPNDTTLTILPSHVNNKPRSRRPKKDTKEVHKAVEAQVCRNRYRREKNCADIAGDLSKEGINVSASTV
ncbi:hypothetical protein CCHL11_08806 [Colletotrichum chlorophyti]|uniref:Transposase Tc1-like domain-containing protein n=1 Tax=Colletotrichum chlorophyti TaxID=708187 RepID=A0A1Q8RZ99_9PEZI|nr:hypothetical protein CCHL11_08806 [Colletotrichum chlorophyti]